MQGSGVYSLPEEQNICTDQIRGAVMLHPISRQPPVMDAWGRAPGGDTTARLQLLVPCLCSPSCCSHQISTGASLGIKTVPMLNSSLSLKHQFACFFSTWSVSAVWCVAPFCLSEHTLNYAVSFFPGWFPMALLCEWPLCSFCRSSSVGNEHIPLFRFLSLRIINFIWSFLNGALKRVLQSCSRLRSSFTWWTYRQLYTRWISRTQREAALHQFVLFTFGSYLSSCKRWELNFWIFNSARKSCFNCKTC